MKKIIPFREATREEAEIAASGNPYVVKILTNLPGTDEAPAVEYILINRPLDLQEIGRINAAKTSEEVHDLLYCVRNINDPTVYEVDLWN